MTSTLEELDALYRASTQGPMTVACEDVYSPEDVYVPRGHNHRNLFAETRNKHNAAWIAAMHNAWPKVVFNAVFNAEYSRMRSLHDHVIVERDNARDALREAVVQRDRAIAVLAKRIDDEDAGRVLVREHPEYVAMLANLTATQAHCTRLLEEVRPFRMMKPLFGFLVMNNWIMTARAKKAENK